MIFIAVGTQKFQFDRLLEQVDQLKSTGEIEEDIYAQTGFSDYQPKSYPGEAFLKKEEFQDYIKKSSLIITHSGVATIMSAIKNHKPVIVVPRLEKYKEHVDDHQVEIAKSFGQQNLVLVCSDVSRINNLIKEARNHKFNEYISKQAGMIQTIREYLNSVI